jgi:tRNA 2-selenouridine synthase
MLKLIPVTELLELQEMPILLDARSEGEFEMGHIPGAISFPILNNEERKLVGTCYKQKGHEPAVILGYELVGNKFAQYVSYAYKHWKGREIYVHCWRGGLRSNIMGNLLSSAGFNVKLIKGGYKVYRSEVLKYLAGNFVFKVLGGYTGSGKTEILKQLEARGAQVLDIEGLASHRGSAFGSLGLPSQPRQEHFENLIFEKLRRFSPNKPVWIEDESRLTGKLQIPDQIYAGLRNSFVYFLDYSIEKRAIQTLSEYGDFEVQLLAETTLKLRKRMGDLLNREAIQLLHEGDKQGWVLKVLAHYDKQYDFGFSKRSVDSSLSLQLEGEELIQYLLTVA